LTVLEVLVYISGLNNLIIIIMNNPESEKSLSEKAEEVIENIDQFSNLLIHEIEKLSPGNTFGEVKFEHMKNFDIKEEVSLLLEKY